MQDSVEAKEKNRAASSSVAAALFLTGMKLVVGLMTGSLGILSEAAHSALDLVAALVTFFAVRVSGRPADASHHYGHGKVENLSALAETLLLVITSLWIIYEAIRRIFFTEVHVEANLWAFGVMGIAIVVDFTRSRILMRAARKYNSQALEADALHFSTDIWSSSVVIVGLLLVWAQQTFALPAAVAKADAVAALGVAIIVLYVSYELGSRTISGLLDTAPPGLRQDIADAVSDLPGVVSVNAVRVRQSGPAAFVDIDIAAGADATLEEAHAVANTVEQRVKLLLPRSDVMVHVDPANHDHDNVYERVRTIAAAHGLRTHSVHVHDIRGRLHVELHAEVPEHLTLEEAHSIVSDMEASLLSKVPSAEDVVTHIEPAWSVEEPRAVSPEDLARVKEEVTRLADEICGSGRSHRILVQDEAGKLSITLHCQLSPEMPITKAHDISERVEMALRSAIPNVGQVVVHLEPVEA